MKLAGDSLGRTVVVGILLSTAVTQPAGAQETALHGFVQANYSVRVSETRPTDPPGDFLLGDQRLELEVARASESGRVRAYAKADFVHDAVDGDARLDVREAFLTLTSSRLDVRLGRQVITWGVGDLVFINDVFPKDWTALIAGQPLQYLKRGSDAANVNLYLGPISAQIVAIPFFEPDLLPDGTRLIGFTPFPGRPTREVKPAQRIEDTELALRVYGRVGRFDAAAYAFRGFWGSPPGMELDGDEAVRFYPGLAVYGVSMQGAFAQGIVSLEAGFYDSRDDPDGRNPAIENSQLRALVGYQRALGDNLTVGAQYYAERVLDHERYRLGLPPSFAARAQTRHNATLRVTRLFNYQTSQVSIFVWGSPNEEDYYVNPEVRHSLSDEVWIAVGANLFGGSRPSTFFGQFDRNDNVYVTARYSF
jgi:hypothetical protein